MTKRCIAPEPNLQSITIRTEEGRRIRQAFLAPKITTAFAVEGASQVTESDLRALAQKHGTNDLHIARVCAIFRVEANAVTPEQRAIAKERNFYTLYSTDGKLSDMAGRTYPK